LQKNVGFKFQNSKSAIFKNPSTISWNLNK